MKSIADDPRCAASRDRLNELAAKSAVVHKQLNAMFSVLGSDQPMGEPSDPVAAVLSLEPGVGSAPPPTTIEKYQVLVRQAALLRKAITHQHYLHEQATRAAARRVFAANSDSYIEHSDQLLEAVDKIIELNEVLQKDQAELAAMGCNELVAVRFPEFGLNEQLPYWRDNLDEQIRALKLTKRAHSDEQ